MATEVLSMGYPLTMTQNTIYALPSVPVRLFTETTAAVIKLSNIAAMTTTTTITLTTGISDVLPAGFIQCTSGTINVKLVKMA